MPWLNLDEFDFHHTLPGLPGLTLVLFGQPGCGACRLWHARLPALHPPTITRTARQARAGAARATGRAQQGDQPRPRQRRTCVRRPRAVGRQVRAGDDAGEKRTGDPAEVRGVQRQAAGLAGAP